MSATVSGVPQLLQDFANLSARSQRGVMRDALRSAARPVVARAKAIVPVRTGALRDRIAQRVSVTQKEQSAIIGFDRKVFYGRFIELGTSKMTAKPFLRPALDESQAAIESAFEAAFERGINRKTEAGE